MPVMVTVSLPRPKGSASVTVTTDGTEAGSSGSEKVIVRVWVTSIMPTVMPPVVVTAMATGPAPSAGAVGANNDLFARQAPSRNQPSMHRSAD
jgi:hypothetical protein